MVKNKRYLFIISLIILAFILNACGPRGHRMGDHRRRHQQGLGMGNDRRTNNPGMRNKGRITSVYNGKNDLSKIPSNMIKATSKYTSLNKEYLVDVCTEDTNSDGKAEILL